MKLIYKFLLLTSFFLVGGLSAVFAEAKYPDFCSLFVRTLKPGDRGIDVSRLQVLLGQEGIAYLNATGFYGPATTQAVRVFQTRNGIYPAGRVGPQTFSVMKRLWCEDGLNLGGDNTYIPIDTRNPELPPSGWGYGGSNWQNSTVPEVSLNPVSSSANNVTISWITRGVNSCNLQKDNEALLSVLNTGQQIFTLFGESRFTLKCVSGNGREYSKTIVVRPNQAISSLPWVNLTISPTQVVVGQSAIVYWTSQNTNYCTSNLPGSSGNLQSSGSVPVTINSGTNIFTFTCYNSSGQSVSQTISATSNINQLQVPTVNSFSYSSGNLNWSTTNTNSCMISGNGVSNSGLQTTGSRYVGTPNVSTTWTLICYGNNNQTVTRQVNFNIMTTSSSLDVSVTTDKSSYSVGESINFNITVRNSSNENLSYFEPICDPFYSFQINGASVFNTPQAQCLAVGNNLVNLAPGQTKNYNLNVPGNVSNITNNSGNKLVSFRFYPSTPSSGQLNITQSISVNVGVNSSNITVNLTGGPSSISSGQAVNLTWTSTNAAHCSISGPNLNLTNQPVNGSTVVYPTQATNNYYVICYNSSNQSVQSNALSVTVNNNNNTFGSSANAGQNSCSGNGQTYAHNTLITTQPYSTWLPTRCCNGLFWGPLGNLIGAPECSSPSWNGQSGHQF